jgi:hypothetical protein
MQIFSEGQAQQNLGLNTTLSEYLRNVSSGPDSPRTSWMMIEDSGKKAATARLFSEILLSHAPCYVYITGWNVWPSSELLDLFYGYRQSRHEHRLLKEAAIHFFGREDGDEFTSIVAMVFYFLWDAYIFDASCDILITISHDEFFSVSSRNKVLYGSLQTSLSRYGYQALETGPS